MLTSPRKVYSTAAVRPADHFAYWRESICRAFAVLDPRVDAGARAAFPSLVEVDAWPGASLSLVQSQAQKVVRAADQIRRDPQDQLFVNFQLAGESQVEQAGHRTCVAAGDVYVVDTSRPYVLDHPQPFRLLCLGVPRDRLIDRAHERLALASARSALGGSAGLARAMVLHLREHGETLSPQEGADALSVICRWLSGALADPPHAKGGDARCAIGLVDLWRRAQALIEARLREPGLTPATLADELNVSLRYLHHAFAHQGTTVAATVRALRLARCAEALATSRSRRTIAAIAQDCGFTDIPHFNRLFRGRFGCSPGEYRRR